MTTELPAENKLVCPNCQALNSPNALICVSCGVNLAEFRAALPRLRELQNKHAIAHLEQLEEDASAMIAREGAWGQKQFGTLLRAALVVAGVLAIMIAIGMAWYARQQQLRRERLAAQYQAAVVCLTNGDYLCARDGFLVILQEEPDYSDAREQLNETRYRLARQYAWAGQWKTAIAALKVLLKENPGDTRALRLLEETYDRWIEDALSRGDLLTAFTVTVQRSMWFLPDE